MFATPADVVGALKRYGDAASPSGGSLITPFRHRLDPDADPFRPGFLRAMAERDELARRLILRLPERERTLLFLWYIADLQVRSIAEHLGVSIRTCYRLRNETLKRLCDDWQGGQGTDENLAAQA